MDRYFFDYRIGEIRKNLDVTFLAPELWNQIVVTDAFDDNKTYRYVYENNIGERLDFMFNVDQFEESGQSFHEALVAHCSNHNFDAEHLVEKYWYMTEELFWSLPHTLY